MKINWKVRFKNKVWLAEFLACIITFAYTILGMLGVYPEVTQHRVVEIVNTVLMFLSLMGVIVDPTTAGMSDSARAMSYEEPYDDEKYAIPEEPDSEE